MVVKGLAQGKATVSARVKGLLGNSTTYTVILTVKPAASTLAKPGTGGRKTDSGDKTLDDARMRQIGDLMKRYEVELKTILRLFDKHANKNTTPSMGELTERNLGLITEDFCLS